MNKKISILGVIFSLALSFVLVGNVSATVGGPTYIGDFLYNNADESVYYTSRSLSGRGCPPILNKISLNTEQISPVFSCEDGEALSSNSNYTDNLQTVGQRIREITSDFNPLTEISLPENEIEVDISYLRSESMPGFGTIRSHFQADVYQNQTKVDSFEIAGCNEEQPFTFAGYAIPGFEKKIILLSSTKGDCFEGGYTEERLHVVGGVDNLILTARSQFKSYSEPLIPTENTLVVFERETMSEGNDVIPPANPSTSTPSLNENETDISEESSKGSLSIPVVVLIALISALLGFVVASLIQRRKISK